jgi:hypothetical protein
VNVVVNYAVSAETECRERSRVSRGRASRGRASRGRASRGRASRGRASRGRAQVYSCAFGVRRRERI